MYIICSAGCSGSNLFYAIFRTMVIKFKLFPLCRNEVIYLLRDVNKMLFSLDQDIMWAAGNFIISENGEFSYKCLYKKIYEKTYKSFDTIIPQETSERFPEDFEFSTHSIPTGIAKWDSKKKHKKYYIIRGVKATIDSQMHFLDQSIYNIEIESKNRSVADVQEEIANIRYKNKNKFQASLNLWIKHISSYFQHQNEFIPIKFETILESPINFIIDMANNFNLDIDKNIAEEIWLKAGKVPVNASGEPLVRRAHQHWKSHFEQFHYDIFNSSEATQLMEKLGYSNIKEDD